MVSGWPSASGGGTSSSSLPIKCVVFRVTPATGIQFKVTVACKNREVKCRLQGAEMIKVFGQIGLGIQNPDQTAHSGSAWFVTLHLLVVLLCGKTCMFKFKCDTISC